MHPPSQNSKRTTLCRTPSALALALALLVAVGCAAPVKKFRSLDDVTQVNPPYPTAISPHEYQKQTPRQPVKQAPQPATEEVAAAEPEETVPYKSTPLQLPEEPHKTIPVNLNKDKEIPPPLPLAPHQRPNNFPVAVAPPQPKPADKAEKQADNPAAESTAAATPASDSAANKSAAESKPAADAPPASASVTDANASGQSSSPAPAGTQTAAEAPAATSPATPATLDAATLAAYAAQMNGFSSPVAEALAMLNAPAPLSFPRPAETPAVYQAQLPVFPQPTPEQVAAAQAAAAQATAAKSSAATEPPQITLASATEPVEPPPAGESETPAAAQANKPSLAEQQAMLIASLEAEIRDRRAAKADQAEIARLELQLRLLYLLAERPDDAVAAIDALSAPERESCKHLLFGLAALMENEPASRAPHRNAKVLRALRDATNELAAGSRLDLRNMAFCEKVEYFGWYTEFPRYEFKPKQQVILYVEVENYAAEAKGPQAFETELQGSYQIFDASGQIIAERQLPLDREVCRNYRRDYFLAYRIYMPDNIPAGEYRLELTIEDLKARGQFQGRKLGQGTIDFSIR